MGFVRYQDVTVTLSAATRSRLEQSNPFNKDRVSEQAVEAIRVALYTIYPPRTAEDWKDTTRFQGVGKTFLLFGYDIFSYLRRRLFGSNEPERYPEVSERSGQITLQIPNGLVKWIEQISHDHRTTIPEATVYAIEYGLKVLETQPDVDREGLGRIWRDIFRALRDRMFKRNA
ncbi:MAG TPA: hypothetical protein VLB68_25100 [Pyrinomonadaceae bacterium]|nr:hypothetical protein [Pyrinomonadaceae bacterium]